MVVKMNKETKLEFKEGCFVYRLPFIGIENAWIILSFKTRKFSAEHFGLDYFNDLKNYTDVAFVTFFYAENGCAAEWEPKHGPISQYEECHKDWSGTNCFGEKSKALPHWFFDYVKDRPLTWSQLAVDEERLKHHLTNGNIEQIFFVLKKWANYVGENKG